MGKPAQPVGNVFVAKVFLEHNGKSLKLAEEISKLFWGKDYLKYFNALKWPIGPFEGFGMARTILDTKWLTSSQIELLWSHHETKI